MASEEGVRAGSREILLRLDGAPRVEQKYHRYKNVGFAVALVYKRFQMMLSSLYLHQYKHGMSKQLWTSQDGFGSASNSLHKIWICVIPMCNLHQRELKTRGRKSRGGLCPFLAATVGEFYSFNCFFCGKMKQNTVELSILLDSWDFWRGDCRTHIAAYIYPTALGIYMKFKKETCYLQMVSKFMTPVRGPDFLLLSGMNTSILITIWKIPSVKMR